MRERRSVSRCSDASGRLWLPPTLFVGKTRLVAACACMLGHRLCDHVWSPRLHACFGRFYIHMRAHGL